MQHDPLRRAQIAMLLEALDQQHRWQLNLAQQQAYIQAGDDFLPALYDAVQWANTLTNYHLDHQYVEALRDGQHPQHDAFWGSWVRQIVRTTLTRRPGTYDQRLSDTDDLAQLALEAIYGSIVTFGYRSRFSTWAYAVAMRRIVRHQRKWRTQRRAGQVESIEQYHSLPEPAADPAGPVEAAALVELIDQILRAHGGERLALVFRLWALEDRRLVEIGQIVHISAGRVSGLLADARLVLRQHPALHTWMHDGPPAASDR